MQGYHGSIVDHRRLAWISLAALVLGVVLAPRPGLLDEIGLPEALHLDELQRIVTKPSGRYAMASSPTLPASVGLPKGLGTIGQALSVWEDPGIDEEVELGYGWLSGHVVDGNGLPVGGAVIHIQGPHGVEAHRIADDGEFHLQVTEGPWSVEAGWFDGEDEWRSRASSIRITPGATSHLALEILLDGAAHAVHAGLREAMGMGFEVLHHDGPLRKGDVLVEVDGKLLTDMQPEAVRAALRERPGRAYRSARAPGRRRWRVSGAQPSAGSALGLTRAEHARALRRKAHRRVPRLPRSGSAHRLSRNLTTRRFCPCAPCSGGPDGHDDGPEEPTTWPCSRAPEWGSGSSRKPSAPTTCTAAIARTRRFARRCSEWCAPPMRRVYGRRRTR